MRDGYMYISQKWNIDKCNDYVGDTDNQILNLSNCVKYLEDMDIKLNIKSQIQKNGV